MDTKCINQKISKVGQNDRKKLDSTGTKTQLFTCTIYKNIKIEIQVVHTFRPT